MARLLLFNENRKNEEILYLKNQNNENNDIYYGILGFNVDDYYGIEKSKNLFISKNYKDIINNFNVYYVDYIWKYVIFYKIIGQNPYLITIDILRQLPDSHCEFIYIVSRHRRIKYYFTIIQKDIPTVDLMITNIKYWRNLKYNDNKLNYILYNNIDYIRESTIKKSLKLWLNRSLKKYLKLLLNELNIRCKWYHTKKMLLDKIVNTIMLQ